MEHAHEVPEGPHTHNGNMFGDLPPRTDVDPTPTNIRKWARANGFEVSDKGKIAKPIMEAWERRNQQQPKPISAPKDDWEITTDWSYNGRSIVPGTELKIRGERGRFLFKQHVRTSKGVEWIDVIGGEDKNVAYRSFRPERVQTVHRIQRTRSNAA